MSKQYGSSHLSAHVQVKGTYQSLQDGLDKMDAHAKQIDSLISKQRTQMRYNWVQWQQFSRMILSQLKETTATRIFMAGIELGNILDMQRRIALEIGIQAQANNWAGVIALTGISAMTAGLTIASKMRQAELSREKQRLQTITTFQNLG